MYLFSSKGHFGHKFTASDGQSGDKFGFAVASCGKVVVIGAPGGHKSGVRTGTAYIFDLDWKVDVRKLTATDGAAGDHFGGGVAVYGDTI
ncbi:MAG: hypothetical protein GY696_13395, partial [Gammaproteobacteria bacterium]|nr:hypothetical protein [Gammaproteobacteria bacterium]